MRRDAKIQEYNLYVDNYLPDNQSLLIQLCEKIFRSGFVFHDSTIGEIHAGEWVIRDFFDQQAEVFVDLVSRERLNSFTDYLKNFDWSREQLKTKLFQRIIKAFDRLAIGKHHHFNIRKNIALGLDNKDNHPLYDLLLYVETYYNLILVSKSIECEEFENNPNFTKKISKLEDLIKLRNQIQNKLIFRELVKRSLNDIAKIRGISIENLIPIEKKPERQYPRIIFVRPSTQNFKTQNNIKSKLKKETEILHKPTDIVDLRFKPILSKDQSDHMKHQLENIFEKSQLDSDNDFETTKTIRDETIKSESDNYDDSDKETQNYSLFSDSYDEDVVFGNKEISQTAMENFVMEYPDSTLKFIFRKNLDGRPLLSEIEEIYHNWEKRGLIKVNLKKYILKLMEWPEIPDLPIQKILQILREKIYEISKENGR